MELTCDPVDQIIDKIKTYIQYYTHEWKFKKTLDSGCYFADTLNQRSWVQFPLGALMLFSNIILMCKNLLFTIDNKCTTKY